MLERYIDERARQDAAIVGTAVVKTAINALILGFPAFWVWALGSFAMYVNGVKAEDWLLVALGLWWFVFLPYYFIKLVVWMLNGQYRYELSRRGRTS